MFRSVSAVAALMLSCGLAQAEVRHVTLAPPAVAVAFRAYGMGLFPLDGNFTRFAGILTYDDQQAGVCRVDLQVDVASLAMSNQGIRDDLIGPEFMNAAQFPTLRFQGACQGADLAGDLAMHGQTHSFKLELSPEGHSITAQGRLRRAEWGITGRPLVGGSTARITVEVPLPTAWPPAGSSR